MTQPIDPTPPVKDTPPKTQAEMTWSSNISGGFGCPLVMREAYGRAMELSENPVDVFIALGNLELQQGDARTAAERYERALAQNPNLPSAQRGLVLAYRQAGDSAAAAQAIARFSNKVFPPSTPAMNGP